MVHLPDEVKSAIEKQDMFSVATSDKNCIPNVIYVKYLKVIDDNTILMVDNYFNKTRDNIIHNGKIAFAVLDEDKGSYQLKGTAKRLTKGNLFDEMQNWVPDRFPRVAAVKMKIEEIYNGAKLLC